MVNITSLLCRDSLLSHTTLTMQYCKPKPSVGTPHTHFTHTLHTHALTDTLGTLARTIGEDMFRPLAQDYLALGMVRLLLSLLSI